MINKLPIYTNRTHTGSEYFINDISTFTELFINHLELNAEDYLLSIKELYRILNSIKNNQSEILTVGIDILKDIFLSQLLNVKFECLDISYEFVNNAKNLIKRLGCENNLIYLNNDIKNFPINNKFDIVLLTQMDYIFNDDELSGIVEKIYASNVKYIVITSRSIYKVSFKNFFYELIFNILYSLKTIVTKTPESYKSYRRRHGHFLDIMDKHFFLTQQSSYKTKSGPIRFMVFQKRTL